MVDSDHETEHQPKEGLTHVAMINDVPTYEIDTKHS